MKTKRRTAVERSSRKRRTLGISDSVLKLFPKTSRMGRTDGPSQWEQGSSEKMERSRRLKTAAFTSSGL